MITYYRIVCQRILHNTQVFNGQYSVSIYQSLRIDSNQHQIQTLSMSRIEIASIKEGHPTILCLLVFGFFQRSALVIVIV